MGGFFETGGSMWVWFSMAMLAARHFLEKPEVCDPSLGGHRWDRLLARRSALLAQQGTEWEIDSWFAAPP